MNVLIVGSGGREHAIGFCLLNACNQGAAEPDLFNQHKLFFAPGNPGTISIGTNVPIAVDQLEDIVNYATENKIDLVIIGPELPLSLGIKDLLEKEGIPCFGPTKEAARMETSKNFAKEIMVSAGVPTAGYAYCDSLDKALTELDKFISPYVIKADGLAAGKGVVVTKDKEEARQAINSIFGAGEHAGVVLEEFLTGKEASYIVMTDGERVVPLPTAHDYKRAFDGDSGPNTGGMGTVSPTPNLTKEQESEVLAKVIYPTLKELNKRGTPFCGFLYAGLMISPIGEIKVIEFNARLGDPEAQVLMRRWQGDLLQTIYALSSGRPLPEYQPPSSQAAVCIVIAGGDYPASSAKGDEIKGIDQANACGGIVVFHAGTAIDSQSRLITNGGRILAVTATAETQHEARLKAYQAAAMIEFEGARYRKDIAEE